MDLLLQIFGLVLLGIGLSLASLWNALAGKPVKMSYVVVFGTIFVISSLLLLRERSTTPPG